MAKKKAPAPRDPPAAAARTNRELAAQRRKQLQKHYAARYRQR